MINTAPKRLMPENLEISQCSITAKIFMLNTPQTAIAAVTAAVAGGFRRRRSLQNLSHRKIKTRAMTPKKYVALSIIHCEPDIC